MTLSESPPGSDPASNENTSSAHSNNGCSTDKPSDTGTITPILTLELPEDLKDGSQLSASIENEPGYWAGKFIKMINQLLDHKIGTIELTPTEDCSLEDICERITKDINSNGDIQSSELITMIEGGITVQRPSKLKSEALTSFISITRKNKQIKADCLANRLQKRSRHEIKNFDRTDLIERLEKVLGKGNFKSVLNIKEIFETGEGEANDTMINLLNVDTFMKLCNGRNIAAAINDSAINIINEVGIDFLWMALRRIKNKDRLAKQEERDDQKKQKPEDNKPGLTQEAADNITESEQFKAISKQLKALADMSASELEAAKTNFPENPELKKLFETNAAE